MINMCVNFTINIFVQRNLICCYLKSHFIIRSRMAIYSISQLAIVFPTRYHPSANLYRARLNAVSTVQVVDTIIHDKSSVESLA